RHPVGRHFGPPAAPRGIRGERPGVDSPPLHSADGRAMRPPDRLRHASGGQALRLVPPRRSVDAAAQPWSAANLVSRQAVLRSLFLFLFRAGAGALRPRRPPPPGRGRAGRSLPRRPLLREVAQPLPPQTLHAQRLLGPSRPLDKLPRTLTGNEMHAKKDGTP